MTSSPTASTTSGRVRGFSDEQASVFLGIPYAAPPVGEHRFLAPAPPASWDGVRDALAYGPTAPQKDPVATIIPEPVEPGDDFLNLNVFTPELGAADLPVFVWIHGGGFVSGCNRSPWYRGTRFARDGVVLVSIGYRLGVEGFLEIEGAPSNRAVLDWIAGLEWVRDNIAAFGGNPSDVTIGGQSAGSAACITLLVNPRAEGLFKKVIAMSGTADSRMPVEAAQELAAKVAAHVGAEPTLQAFAKFSPMELVEAHAAVAGNPFSRDSLMSGFDPKGPALRPFADGSTIVEHPFRAIAAGRGSDIPVLTGSTAEEINGVIRMQKGSMDEDTAVSALGSMGLVGERLDRYLDHMGAKDPIDGFAQAATDRAFREPLSRLLEDRAATNAPTYAYQFTWPSPLFDGVVGSAHCLDIPFAFDNLDAERVSDGLIGPNPPQQLADEMHASWVSFIKTGEPGWRPYTTGDRAVKVFDTPSKIVDDALGFEREIFKRTTGDARSAAPSESDP